MGPISLRFHFALQAVTKCQRRAAEWHCMLDPDNNQKTAASIAFLIEV